VIIFFLAFCITIFSENAQKENKAKVGNKTTFFLIDDNFLKQKALDRFAFAWGGVKGFFFEKA